MEYSAVQIASWVDGEIEGDASVSIFSPSKIEDANKGTITFLGNKKYTEYIYNTSASIVLVDKAFVAEKTIKPTLIRVDNVYASLAILMEKFNSSMSIHKGISNLASIASGAMIGEDTCIDDFVIVKPYVKIGKNTKIFGQVFIGDGAEIGDNVVLYPGVKIYHNCIVGNNCIIHANVVIGSDGFGFARNDTGGFEKIPQTGNVILEDNVEIGSNTVIDRASIGSTIIKKGAKLDNLIQVAHNVTVGHHTVIAAQTGISGSTQIGDGCMIGGQAGLAGHIKIAEGTLIQAQSGVASSTEKGAKLYGSPALDYQNYLKSYAYFKRLPEIIQQLREIQTKVDVLTQKNQ
ncbi:MAG: UDP-3-O-(3-hydroxymyristoyl)glucosamine N-acyltransferase [Saprospiraceae bacterium]|nr:UDP-3-O-(3-hydroxymyristoyl)glucosamine N-acyltransferase [Saprospiraceae bacterium]